MLCHVPLVRTNVSEELSTSIIRMTIIGELGTSAISSNQVTPHLSSQGWVDPVPDPLLLRKSGNTGNRTWHLWVCREELWPLDHRGGPLLISLLPENVPFTYYIWPQLQSCVCSSPLTAVKYAWSIGTIFVSENDLNMQSEYQQSNTKEAWCLQQI
jgi:hypothetical protein